MKNILVCFGGISAEHEVSVITGLQVLEHIDRTKYNPKALYVSAQGKFYLMDITNRSEFLSAKRQNVKFGVDEKGGFVQTKGLLSQKVYPDCAYFAFHGGNGESGQLQGLCESFQIPYTSASVESSSVSMNKALTKEVVSNYNIATIPGISILSEEVKNKNITKEVLKKIKLPVIVKPSHLGSSIGVTIAKTQAALTKALLAASHVDTEIVIEKLMEKYTEYNCSVRIKNGKLETSEVEAPLKRDEILSFADKYERGGNKKSGGMASLNRQLPAKINTSLKNEIQQMAKDVYLAVRAKGVVRCDFMYANKKLYLIEVNPIPGSLSYYLWEASGVSFEDQITDLIEETLAMWSSQNSKRLSYETDIIKKFVESES